MGQGVCVFEGERHGAGCVCLWWGDAWDRGCICVHGEMRGRVCVCVSGDAGAVCVCVFGGDMCVGHGCVCVWWEMRNRCVYVCGKLSSTLFPAPPLSPT